MSHQSQKAIIFLYNTNISIIKLENEQCLAPEKVKQQLYQGLIITRASFCNFCNFFLQLPTAS